LSEVNPNVMRFLQFAALLLSSALVGARPGLLDNLGILQNLGLVQDSQPGQYIKGDPSKGDVRSPCPGVNVLANHGYLYVDVTSSEAQVQDC
jgi:hypothetical protein